jgi:hypothetical protein
LLFILMVTPQVVMVLILWTQELMPSLDPPRRVSWLVELGEWKTGPLMRRYGKFCVVGGSGVLVDMAVLGVLATGLDWNLSLAQGPCGRDGHHQQLHVEQSLDLPRAVGCRVEQLGERVGTIQSDLPGGDWLERAVAERGGALAGLERVSGQRDRDCAGERVELLVERTVWMETSRGSTGP